MAQPPAFEIDMGKVYRATIETDRGRIVMDLDPKLAPQSVNNFVALSRQGYYDGLTFHRVVPAFVIQGGCPEGSGRGGPGYKFADEFHPSLRHSKKGILSMANSGPNTNGSQFFVTVAETSWLDNKHTVFGEVVEGYDVVEKISKVPRGAQDRPSKDVQIRSVTIERT